MSAEAPAIVVSPHSPLTAAIRGAWRTGGVACLEARSKSIPRAMATLHTPAGLALDFLPVQSRKRARTACISTCAAVI